MLLRLFHNHFFDSTKKQFLSLLFVSSVFQVVFLLASPIGFECDAAMFYNYAKALIFMGRSASDYRPPAFPFFLLITGQVWPGTFLITILIQLIMGALTPLLVFGILRPFGSVIAFVSALLTIFSTISYNYSTLILSDQLFGFTFVLSIYFFSKFYFEATDRNLKLFIFTSLICTFTRWEGIFLLANGVIYISYIYFKAKKYKLLVTLNICLLMIFFFYTVIRAAYFHDAKMIGTLQNGSGLQLFYRAYTADYPAFQKNKPRDVQSLSNSSAGQRDEGNSTQFVSVSNGPSTQKLRDIVENYAAINPESYRGLKKSILSLPISNSYRDSYEMLFGQFDGQPKKMADYIFTAPTSTLNSQYLFYINTAVKQSLGVVDGDKLLVKSAIETFVANPIIVFSMFNDSLSILGLDLFNYLSGFNAQNLFLGFDRLLPYWGKYHYDWMDFDLGKCASNTLSLHMIEELKQSYRAANKNLNIKLVEVASFNRNLTRAALGIFLIILGWSLALSRNKFFAYILVGTFIPMLAIYGIYIGGAYTRYEVATIPMMIIISALIISELKDKLSNLFRL